MYVRNEIIIYYYALRYDLMLPRLVWKSVYPKVTFELWVILPPLRKCWDYRHLHTTNVICIGRGTKPRTSCLPQAFLSAN